MPPDILTLEGAALGLLALMIGFTFSMALTRFEVRLSAVVTEANAISTVALRAHLLPEPQAGDVKTLLRDYVQLRLDLGHASQSLTSLKKTIRRPNELQRELWQHAVSVKAADPNSTSADLLIQALNDMFAAEETHLTAARNSVPSVVFVLLYGVAVVAMGFSGYVAGIGTRRGRVPLAIMAVLIAGVVGMIQDIDRSQSGFVTVGQEAIQDVKDNLHR